jgi:hypothetical protein
MENGGPTDPDDDPAEPTVAEVVEQYIQQQLAPRQISEGTAVDYLWEAARDITP